MFERSIISQGHLIDSGIMSRILNLIIDEKADYKIIDFTIGKKQDEISYLEILLICDSAEKLNSVTEKLVLLGAWEKGAAEPLLKTADRDGAVPPDFYSTSNHRTEIYYQGDWHKVSKQRMDAMIRKTSAGFECIKLRDVRKGDLILCGSDSVRLFPPDAERQSEGFGFMTNDVSSERSDNIAVRKVAETLEEMKAQGKKAVVVAGPVVVHTGGAGALAALIREGYIQGFLGGNAIAVHDLESQFYGTSLGVDLTTGKPTHGGHFHHMRAINKINTYGSISAAIKAGEIKAGLMYEVVKSGIPYCLAGSIRDDGPLPETVMDMIEAQNRYSEIIKGTDMLLMLSTMLHSIGAGNMTPSWVKTICVDINPAVVTKLSDRGTGQAVGIVSDVGLFLRTLANQMGLVYGD
ncbi:TIGR00300 family protein [Spirochaeta isovalerica]|uniref:ornithine cyclodeaminase n=1 Tax=Spirochaeta isovalerica TaxID=150 RepID=A0A841R811_9SPIO|nr:TIGR00300 family protein [Spirochaeta isovalerica]MBB6479327.1 lysine-ketoglutarate reductase/saccharopine dehydrogenase-like protein (TIGR00300 family) [Spirochaeta isovalerica]